VSALDAGELPARQTTYATIFVKPAEQTTNRRNASTPTEPTERCLSTSDCRSETGDIKGRAMNCQAEEDVNGSHAAV